MLYLFPVFAQAGPMAVWGFVLVSCVGLFRSFSELAKCTGPYVEITVDGLSQRSHHRSEGIDNVDEDGSVTFSRLCACTVHITAAQGTPNKGNREKSVNLI